MLQTNQMTGPCRGAGRLECCRVISIGEPAARFPGNASMFTSPAMVPVPGLDRSPLKTLAQPSLWRPRLTLNSCLNVASMVPYLLEASEDCRGCAGTPSPLIDKLQTPTARAPVHSASERPVGIEMGCQMEPR